MKKIVIRCEEDWESTFVTVSLQIGENEFELDSFQILEDFSSSTEDAIELAKNIAEELEVEYEVGDEVYELAHSMGAMSQLKDLLEKENQDG